MASNKTDSKSFEAGSVHSDCSELNTLFTNLSATHFNSGSTNESTEPTVQSDKIHSEIIGLIEEKCPLANVNTAIRLNEKQRVVLVKCRPKSADHKKMGYRQTPNPWRRHGSFKTICKIGGWITSRGEKNRFQHVTPGTSSTPDPKASHMALHKDPAILNQKFFIFEVSKNVDSQTLANAFGRQVAESAIHIRRSKHLTSKNANKTSFESSRRR